MPYPRVIPHSDSSGIVDEVGEGVPRGMDRPTRVVLWRSIVPPFRNRRRVHRGSLAAGGSNPRSRAAGTRGLSRHPGITAHRAVHVTGPIEGRTVLVQGGAGAVGARWSGASHSSPEWLQDRESDCAWSPHRRGVGPPFYRLWIQTSLGGRARAGIDAPTHGGHPRYDYRRNPRHSE